LLLVAAAFLVAALGAAWWVTRLRPDISRPGVLREEHAAIGGSAWQGLRSVARSPYLLAICGYVLILAVMVTFLYFTRREMGQGRVPLPTTIVLGGPYQIQLEYKGQDGAASDRVASQVRGPSSNTSFDVIFARH